MRFINTSTLKFEERELTLGLVYAILSHRWGTDEVSYQDWLDDKKRDGPGYTKIIEFCRLANGRGYKIAWVDTCM